jgi:hypothetical protein
LKPYRQFLTIAILLLCLMALGISASVEGVPAANQIIVAALTAFVLLIEKQMN